MEYIYIYINIYIYILKDFKRPKNTVKRPKKTVKPLLNIKLIVLLVGKMKGDCCWFMIINRSLFKVTCHRRGLSNEATEMLYRQVSGDWSAAIHRLAMTRDKWIQRLNRLAFTG